MQLLQEIAYLWTPATCLYTRGHCCMRGAVRESSYEVCALVPLWLLEQALAAFLHPASRSLPCVSLQYHSYPGTRVHPLAMPGAHHPVTS
jgi:hypothetical protein